MHINRENSPQNEIIEAAIRQQTFDVGLTKLIDHPFVVQINGQPLDEFYDVRDAIGAARRAKRDHPFATIAVVDIRSGIAVQEM